MTKFKDINEFKEAVLTSPEIQESLKNDPLLFVKNIETKTPITIPGVFITVVVIVGLALFATLTFGGIIALDPPTKVTNEDGSISLLTREIPEFIIMIGSAALGALSGLLVPTPTKS